MIKQSRNLKKSLRNNQERHSLLDDIAETLNCIISDLRLNSHLRKVSLLIISHLGNEYSSLEREKAIDYLTVDNEEFILETKGKEETDG